MQNRNFSWIGCILLLILPSLGFSQTLTLRSSTSIYAWENQYVDSTYESAKSLRAFQSIRFDAYQVADPAVSLHGYVRGMYDLGAEAGTNPDYRVYNLYARWQSKPEKPQRWDVRLGRQPIFTSARSVTADAVRIELVNRTGISAMGFFGALPPLDGNIEVLKPFERRAWGGKLYTSQWLKTNAAISYIDKSREGPIYRTLDSGGGDSLVVRPDLEERLASLDLNRDFGKYVTWFYHADYDFLQSEIQKISTDIQTHVTPELDVSLRYAYRRPRVYESTIFGAFSDLESNQEVWLRAAYRFNPRFTAGAEYANVFYKLKDAWRWGLFASYDRVGVNYSRREGYGGTMDAVALTAYHRVHPKVGLSGSLSYYRFDFGGDDITESMVVDPISQQVLDNVNTSVTTILRANCLVSRSLSVDVEGQYLTQNLKASPVYGGQKSDWRMFIRANYWLFSRW